MDIQMSIPAYCGSIAPKPSPSNMSNIIDYCKYASAYKALSQKGTKQFNTAGNDTKISKVMQNAQTARTGKYSTYSIDSSTGGISGAPLKIPSCKPFFASKKI